MEGDSGARRAVTWLLSVADSCVPHVALRLLLPVTVPSRVSGNPASGYSWSSAAEVRRMTDLIPAPAARRCSTGIIYNHNRYFVCSDTGIVSNRYTMSCATQIYSIIL